MLKSDKYQVVVAVALIAALAFAHDYTSRNAEGLAARLVTETYMPMTPAEAHAELDARAGGRYLGPEGLRLYREIHSENAVRLTQAAHRAEWQERHVDPIEERIQAGAAIGFPIGYLVAGSFVVGPVVRWVKTVGARMLRMLLALAGLAGDGAIQALGLPSRLSRRRLRAAEKEFMQLKNLYDNDLITETEFIAKKETIRRKIRLIQLEE